MAGKVSMVVGTNFGDEGKGKIIDYLAQKFDMVARATGGNNAGHKVVINGKEYPLHLLPSGVFNPKAKVIIGNGVYVNPIVLANEIKSIEADGFDVMNRLYISEKAHVIMLHHPLIDELEEGARSKKIGTTKRGIGPVAEDKYSRDGMRFSDFAKIFENIEYYHDLSVSHGRKENLSIFYLDYVYSYILKQAYGRYSRFSDKIKERLHDFIEDKTISEFCEAMIFLLPRVCDTISLIHEELESGKNLLIEGAQATLLDIDFGTYPFVTSSNPTSAGMCTGVGIGPTFVSEVIGVLKAYSSRVGEGVFVTEEDNEIGNKIRKLGHEYGTTTGRPRRCGWLDLVALKYACRVNGLTGLAINHIDTIGKLKNFKACIAYRDVNDDKILYNFTSESKILSHCKPIYKEFKGGFKLDKSKIKSVNDLPKEALDYLQFIANYTHTPIKYVGIGPSREDLIMCDLKPEI